MKVIEIINEALENIDSYIDDNSDSSKTLAEHVDLLLSEMPEIDQGYQPKDLFNRKYLDKLTPLNVDVEGLPLWSAKIDSNTIVFAIKDENEKLLSFVLTMTIPNFENSNKTALVIKFSFTEPDARGNGYSPALYYGLYQMGYIIISDAQVSSAANKVWDKVVQRSGNKIKGYDWSTKSFTDDDAKGNNNISYVLMDHIDIFTRKYVLFEGKLILKQMKRFTPH